MSDKQQATSNTENNNLGTDLHRVWKTVSGHVCKFYHCVIGEIKSPWPEESRAVFCFWILSIIIDPLVLYFPRINDGKKWLHFDRTLLSVLLGLYLIIWFCKLLIYVIKYKKSKAGSYRYSLLWLAFVVFAPLVPIVTNVTLQFALLFNATKDIRTSVFSIGTIVFLILYLVRVLGIYRLFIATALGKSAVLRIMINLLLYLYGGHLFGGLWYLFAVWKQMQCWNEACINRGHAQCYYENRRFIVISGDKTFLDDICFSKTKDTTNVMGIFKDALESHIVDDSSNLAGKLLYCFRWGIQNLSGYGQNLEVSTRTWENIFVLVIAVYGMATFAFFIGNMQNLINPSTSKSDKETRWTEKNLEKWSLFGKLNKEVQDLIVTKCRQCNWPQTGVFNVKNLLSNLPEDVEDDIKRILCLKLLRKVKKFETWSEPLLVELCKYAMPVSYEKHTQIVQNGSLIEEMFFVVEGKLQICSFTIANADSPRTPGYALVSHLEDDGFCGEELVNLFEADPNSSILPISSRTIRVVKQVDAFAITSYDLQNVFIKRQADQAPPAES